MTRSGRRPSNAPRPADPKLIAADVAARRGPVIDAITASAQRVRAADALPTKVAVRIFNALGEAAAITNRELDQLEGKESR